MEPLMIPQATPDSNKLRWKQNGCHIADYIFKCIFLTKNISKLIKISLKFAPDVSIDSGIGWVPDRQQAITWTNNDPVHWQIYESLGLNGLTH